LLGKLDTLPRDRQAAFCTLELALLDLAGHSFGASAGQVLGPVLEPEVRYSAVIAASAPEAAVALAHRARQAGFAEVKIKVGPDLEDNLRLLAAVREVLGADADLRVDANCAWTTDEALRQLRAFGEFSLCGVEQPLVADDLDGLRALTQAGLVPVVVDESLASMADARRLIEQQACNVFNLRVSKCGGLLNTGRLHRLAQENGLACQLGAQVGETGLLSAAGRHVATRCRDLLWLEGSFDALLLQAQLTGPDITFGQGGRAPALRGPGLGVAPLSDPLSRHTVDRRRLSI
jgi:muconate cycloisomerase